jgi:hypothetical protein
MVWMNAMTAIVWTPITAAMTAEWRGVVMGCVGRIYLRTQMILRLVMTAIVRTPTVVSTGACCPDVVITMFKRALKPVTMATRFKPITAVMTADWPVAVTVFRAKT